MMRPRPDPGSSLDLPTVTALRNRGPSHVEVHLDGRCWRSVPVDVAVAARLAVGVGLDRERARDLNRALRHHRALSTAMRTLRWSDQTRATLDRRLAELGVGSTVRRSTLERLERIGAVDDARFADVRAAALSKRGAGDAMIGADLVGRGIDEGLVDETVARLPPESIRAAAILERRGHSPATLRFLARRGFSEDTLESLVAAASEEGVG